MEHTPIPWRELAPGVIAGATDPGWGAIAQVSQTEAEPEARATAAFIVRAVNNHAALLEALEGYLAEHESHPSPEDGAAVAVCPGCWEAETKARAAIKSAQEPPAT